MSEREFFSCPYTGISQEFLDWRQKFVDWLQSDFYAEPRSIELIAAMTAQKPDASTPKCCGHPMQKSAIKPNQRYCTWCRSYKTA